MAAGTGKVINRPYETGQPTGGNVVCSRNPICRLLLLCLVLMLGMPEAVSRSGEATETYREAYDQGFRDGRIAGARDRAQNRRFDLANEQEFQSADHGFDEQRHEREVFILGYRRGFEDGYEQGYGLENEGQEPVPSSPMSVPVADDSRPPARTIRRSRARDELLPAELKIRLDLLDSLSTKYSKVGDTFQGRVVEDVIFERQELIPRGTRVIGAVSFLKRAGRIKGRAKMSLRFDELRFPDGRLAAIEASVLKVEPGRGEKVRDDEDIIVSGPSKGRDAKKVGRSSTLGALIGAIAGGTGGAGVGAAAGAVAGLANVLVTRGRDAELEAGTQLTIKLDQEARVMLSRP